MTRSHNQASNDQRAEFRLASQLDVILSLPGSSMAPEEETLLITRCEDLSANGLRLRVDTPINAGTLLQVAVRHKTQGVINPLVLVAEVKWAEAEADGARIGLQLFDSEGSHIGEWKQLVAGWLSGE